MALWPQGCHVVFKVDDPLVSWVEFTGSGSLFRLNKETESDMYRYQSPVSGETFTPR